MQKIIIIEDQLIVNALFKDKLSSKYEIVATSDDASKMYELAKTYKPDLILTDVVTKDNNSGLLYGKEVKEKLDVKVLAMTAMSEVTFLKLAKEGNLDGLIYKNVSIEELFEAIDRVLNGDKVFSDIVYNKNNEDFNKLTKQELKILTMLCSGLEREAIAKELNITTGTLKNHISSILNKMEFDSITKLLVYCVKNGYIIPSEEQ